MTNDHLLNKTIVITGAGGGFGRLVAQKAAMRGAKVTLGDINGGAVEVLAAELRAAGASAQAFKTDVSVLSDMQQLVKASVESYGSAEVMVNNAGIMPLAFFSDHAIAYDAWIRCIDVNIKGVLNGMVAAYDAMIAGGRGHVVNISSIYGNFPVTGAAVYGASKAAVNVMSESLRVEGRGKIKVTLVKPTGVPGTGLSQGIINREAAIGIIGHHVTEFMEKYARRSPDAPPDEQFSDDDIRHTPISPERIADAIVHVIDQPWGISISDVTIRATDDMAIL